MTKEVSKTQVDRLGDRLKRGNITEEDLRLLDQYRRSFAEAYETVVGIIRDKLKLEPTGRPAKSTTSIADKLKRESIRLTQIQDIAGCRIIVADIAEQESVIQSLTGLFQQITVIDRREKPSHGYRAVHVVVNRGGKLIEIQVRTSLQHVWAELSEKYSDVIDRSIKYGGGDAVIQQILQVTSKLIANEELDEKLIDDIIAISSNQISDDLMRKIDDTKERLKQERLRVYKDLKDFSDEVLKLKEEHDDFSN
jgi:ppGpp synthetase/RelA/SpoT-type nucleotidyltranferase